jgi:CubicO group peptidase (beta-lactamase class C family)
LRENKQERSNLMANELDFNTLADPTEVGVDPQGLARLNELFDGYLAEEDYHAAQMVVAKDDQVVMDRAAGSFRGQPVLHDTPFYTFSVSKPFTGMCVHKLVEEGKVALDAPVAEYWPGFARRGKGGIAIKNIFTHTAGIHGYPRYRQIPLWPFWRLTMADCASMTPLHPPGEQMAYHPLTWGFVLGEVVRRVSGMPFKDYFHQHFAEPLGLENTWFRIPLRALRRSPKLVSGVEDQDLLVRIFNLLPIRRAVMPASSLNSTAREMAVFYQMLVNGGSYGRKQLVKPETIEQATSLAYRGWDHLVERDTLWAYGFHLGGRDAETSKTDEETVFGARSTGNTFGHMGNRTCMAWADKDHRLVVTFTCDRLTGYMESRVRWRTLNNAVWDMLGV